MILKANRLPPKEAIKYLESHLRALEEERGRLEVEIYKITDYMMEINKSIKNIKEDKNERRES